MNWKKLKNSLMMNPLQEQYEDGIRIKEIY
jgi:hypothetical protein